MNDGKPLWTRTFLQAKQTFHARPLWARAASQDVTDDPLDPNSLLPHTKPAGDPLQYVKDPYQEQPPAAEMEWQIDDRDMPYLRHMKSLQTAWPHLRYLVQWMEVSTVPIKWAQIKQVPELARQERASRTKVAVVDFAQGQDAKVRHIDESAHLSEFLDKPKPTGISRLFIVEDLSREVVEHLGWKLDIDPLFFREHINDYKWYNTRDTWVELPDLNLLSRDRPYYRLSYVQPRYFVDKKTFMAARTQAGKFNVLRRLDDDSEHKALFDSDKAIVALVRSKASLWIKPSKCEEHGQGDVAVLLMDPSITEGFPLWRGYRPFVNSPTPSEARASYPAREKKNVFDDLLFWIKHMSREDLDSVRNNPQVMAFRMAQIICAEWLTLSQYIMARLGQIEWELERPDFRKDSDDIDASLAKLHTWRRRLPLYTNMVADTKRKLFGSSGVGVVNVRVVGNGGEKGDCMAQLRPDFDMVAKGLDELYERTERIATVATAVTAIEESRRAMEQNRSLGRLTYLAVIFAPLSFITSLLSMTDDVASLHGTLRLFFSIAAPVSLVVFLMVDFSWLAMLRTAFGRAEGGKGGKGKKRKKGGFGEMGEKERGLADGK